MSRRLLLCVLAVAGAAVLAAPALSTGPFAPRAVDFEHRVPGLQRAAAAVDGLVATGAARAPGRFDLVGFAWDDRRPLRIDLRVRRDGENWGRWVRVASADSAPGRSDPVWAGGADAYQLRLGRRPPGLRARFVNVTGTRTAADRARTLVRRSAHAAVLALAGRATAADGTGAGPPVVAREEWAGDQCRPRAAPRYGEVSFGVVHHTATAADYGPEDSAAMVLAICRYHRDHNGWNDIGYNFLVDRFGQVFEGRAGGIEAAVVGAHAQGFNSASTGVAHLGTHSQAPQTADGLRAAAHLLAWKLDLHGAPVAGTVTVRSGGGSSNRHPEGREVSFERISGHRDANHTTCPGDALVAQLPEIRRLAAEYAAAIASGSPASRSPSKLQVARARVRRDRRQLDVLAPISRRAGGTVRASFRAAGRTRRFRAEVDSAAGRVRFRRAIPRAQARLGTGILTLRYPGNARTWPNDVRLRAAPRPSALRVARPTIDDGRVRAEGTVTRRARGVVRVRLEYAVDGAPRVVALRAPIRRGRWRLDERLPPATTAGIERRSGTLHASVQYTGHLRERLRGEMRSLQVLPSR